MMLLPFFKVKNKKKNNFNRYSYTKPTVYVSNEHADLCKDIVLLGRKFENSIRYVRAGHLAMTQIDVELEREL